MYNVNIYVNTGEDNTLDNKQHTTYKISFRKHFKNSTQGDYAFVTDLAIKTLESIVSLINTYSLSTFP